MNYETRNSYRWVVLGIAFLLMSSFAISLQALPPLFDRIMDDIPFSNSQAGMLMGISAIPGIFLPFLIAHLANRFNKKTMILLALSTIILGLVAFSLADSFSMLLIFRLISGIGATVVVVLAPLLVTMFFQQDEMGIAMGVFNTAVPFGTVVAANLFGVLGGVFRWRSIILGIAAFIGAVLAISFLLLSLPEDDVAGEEDAVHKGSQHGFWSNPSLWALGIIWALANAQLLAYVTFGPQYFQGAGIGLQKAGLFTSLIMLIPIFASPLVGIIIDRMGWTKGLLLVGSLVMGLSFLLLSRSIPALGLWAVTLGIGFTPIPVTVFALLPELVKPHQVGMGLGVLTASSNIGITLGPPIFGLLLDNTGGNFQIGFMALASVTMGIILLVRALRTQG
ncbi:MAG TPA: MFS transporter [Tepidimicrobium sp.]|nr:MFS transporter [Tepidimicrobium sp.]